MYNTYRPEGFETVNPYLFAEQAEELIDFLKTVFEAREVNRSMNPQNGDVGNVILKIGSNCLMVSQARGPFLGMRTAFYLYVEEVDQVYDKALSHGAKTVFPPGDQDYGDRQAGIEDPFGNYWWISKRLAEKGYHE